MLRERGFKMADGAGVQEENVVPISTKVRSNTLKRKINFKSCENRGGAFLVLPVSEGDVFSREDFTEDQKNVCWCSWRVCSQKNSTSK